MQPMVHTAVLHPNKLYASALECKSSAVLQGAGALVGNLGADSNSMSLTIFYIVERQHKAASLVTNMNPTP